jgi:hypothetical protein
MKILAVALADDSRRFARGFPPKGARLLLNPDLEIAGLMTVAAGDQIAYQDEKVEVLDLTVGFDLALISTDFWQESRIREVVLDLRTRGKPIVLFGPVATVKCEELRNVADSIIVGNILNVWHELRADAAQGRVKPLYRASDSPNHAVPDLEDSTKPAFDGSFQCLRAIVGCRCADPVRPFCRQYLYHRENLMKRDLEELTGEVCDMRHKHAWLFDEDVAQDRDFYREFFSRVWRFKREWTVLAGDSIFDDVAYVRMLAKAGVRVMMLTETWLSQARLRRMAGNRQLVRHMRNQVRLLHRQRLLVGVRVSLFLEPGQEFDYAGTYDVIEKLNMDFLLVRMFACSERAAGPAEKGGAPAAPFASGSDTCPVPDHQPLFVSYQPGLLPDKPTWWKNQFYGMGSIIRRSLRRPVRVGFYSTVRYYYPRSFAYRQNFLEGIAYPP